jgi:uncharacterized glyoxalase superfamily metalloenzyme YdcJ
MWEVATENLGEDLDGGESEQYRDETTKEKFLQPTTFTENVDSLSIQNTSIQGIDPSIKILQEMFQMFSQKVETMIDQKLASFQENMMPKFQESVMPKFNQLEKKLEELSEMKK